MIRKVSLFLDSGAFSAWSKGIIINIQEYIAFIKKYQEYIDIYANLDCIGDPEQTWKNQLIMEEAGLSPLPCFHYGEDIKYLQRYLEKYNYVALGGMVPISTKDLITWLDILFDKYICDEDGFPKVKIHGFGISTISILLRYPWASIDSTSWVMTGRFGAVLVPVFENGNYDYTQIPHKINVSTKSTKKDDEGQHYCSFNEYAKKQIDSYFKQKGFTYEELSQDYKKRDELNIMYFLDLEKNLSDKPFDRSLVRRGFF